MPAADFPTVEGIWPLTSSSQGQLNSTYKDPAKTLNVSLCHRLFSAHYQPSQTPSTLTSSSSRLKISCQLQGIRLGHISCQDLIFCSGMHLTRVQGADHLSHSLVQQHHNHLKQGLEGLVDALTSLCMARDGNNSSYVV